MFQHIAKGYADNNPAMSNSSACLKYQWLGSTTNGAKWYPKNGTLKDYSYQNTNSLDFVIELSCCKFPRSYFLPREWDNNRESLLLFLETANSGVKGLVLDDDDKPLEGAVVGVVHDEDDQKWAGKNVTSSKKGEYWKLLLPGSYRVKIWHRCYQQTEDVKLSISEDTGKALIMNLKFNERLC